MKTSYQEPRKLFIRKSRKLFIRNPGNCLSGTPETIYQEPRKLFIKNPGNYLSGTQETIYQEPRKLFIGNPGNKENSNSKLEKLHPKSPTFRKHIQGKHFKLKFFNFICKLFHKMFLNITLYWCC